MLVVLSDLHFTDGTPGDHNVKADAFARLMHEIISAARAKKAQELIFLYLGDIFDLVRSQQWQDVPIADRPWSSPSLIGDPNAISGACRLHAEKVLRDITKENREAVEILSGRAAGIAESLAALNIDVRHLYIPGNHDRLYTIDPIIKTEIDRLLGIDSRGMDGLSLHTLESRRYGVLARHGHEFDVWNFEGWARDRFEFNDEDYQRVPIGEVFSAEFITRIPIMVRKNLQEGGIPQNVIETVYNRLLDLDNVRPISAVIPWIYYTSACLCREEPWPEPLRDAVSGLIDTTTRETFDAFMDLPYAKAWLKERDSYLNPIDEADQLQGLQWLLRMGIGVDTLAAGLSAFEHLGLKIEGPQRKAAPKEPKIFSENTGLHYVVYGHTHHYETAALGVHRGREQIYFNSGTWRSRCVRAENDKDFILWKLMSYLIFYADDEDRLGFERKGHSFEAWSGTSLCNPTSFTTPF